MRVTRPAIGHMWLFAVLAIGGVPRGGAAQSVGPEALVESFVRAWNEHDMKAFAGLFVEDADFVNVAGMWWKGRAEIQAKHEETHATRFKSSTLTPRGTTVRLPRADVAIIHFNWELAGALDVEGKPAPVRRGILQMVAVKQAEGWKIVAAQNTNSVPPR